jgi:hypothetical protein
VPRLALPREHQWWMPCIAVIKQAFVAMESDNDSRRYRRKSTGTNDFVQIPEHAGTIGIVHPCLEQAV